MTINPKKMTWEGFRDYLVKDLKDCKTEVQFKNMLHAIAMMWVANDARSEL